MAGIQRFALLQLPFALALAMVARLAAALQVSSVLARVAVVAFVANLTGDILFARWIGIAGIALATAMVQAISLIAVVILLVRRERRLIA